MMKIAICFLGLIANSTLAFTPTVWHLENKTNAQVSINCEGAAPGLGQKLTRVTKVNPNQIETIQWTDHTNDGMGLNASAWQCDAKADTLSGSLTFSTDWGENIILSIAKPSTQTLALTKSNKSPH